MGREAVLYSDKSRLYKNACFPTRPTPTGHSVLIHRGGCRHVAGVKFIRYMLISGQEKQTEKVEGWVQSAARYMRIADSSADVSAMQVVAGEDKLLSHVDSTLDNDLSRKRRGRTTLGCRVVSIPHYRWDVVFC